MKKALRWIVRAALAAGVVAGLQCGGSGEATEILLLIRSRVEVNQVEIIARNLQGDDDTLLENISAGDGLTDEPLALLLHPSTETPAGGSAPIAPPTGRFLIHVKGRNLEGAWSVSWAELVSFVANARTVVELELTEDHRNCDTDEDGFQDCRCAGQSDDPNCDCAPSDRAINVFVVESCTDNIDNNCSGYPPNEGCPCDPGDQDADPPRPPESRDCTTLANLDQAGVGACNFGTQVCGEDARWQEECNGAGEPANADQPGDGIDNDCDGHVDLFGPCEPGETARDCFLGKIGPAATTSGQCRVGLQTCQGGVWGECENEVPPTRVAGFFNEDPVYGCDGLDNDCDGEYDEDFDRDDDDYTICGTCRFDSPCPVCAQPETRDVPRWCDASVDCSEDTRLVYVDNANRFCDPTEGDPDCDTQVQLGHLINPGEPEDCRPMYIESEGENPYENIDEDCRCNLPGDPTSPSVDVTGAPLCLATRLDCMAEPLTTCDDDAPPGPYFFGFYPPNDYSSACHYCRQRYGHTCDASTGSCFTKEDYCSTTACADADRNPTIVYNRPTCCYYDEDFCQPNTPDPLTGIQWECPPVSAGVDHVGDCDPWPCGQASLAEVPPLVPWFHGIDNPSLPNPTCFYMEDVLGTCNSGTCMERDDECERSIRGGAYPRPPEAACLRPTTCTGQDTPTFTLGVLPFSDPYEECPGSCNGLDGGQARCLVQLGQPAASSAECEDDPNVQGLQHLPLVDGVCCAESFCDPCERCVEGSGRCEALNTADDPGYAGTPDTCMEDCTECVNGSCTPRSVGDFVECGGSCQACLAGGFCGNFTGDDGTACDDDDTFCCNGQCVNPPGTTSEFGDPCGSGECAGGTWTCSGVDPRCLPNTPATYPRDCDYCQGDEGRDSRCTDNFGTTCAVVAATPCVECYSCRDNGTTTSCVVTGGSTDYVAGVKDNDGPIPNQCNGIESCDGTGLCKRDLGQTCSTGGDCVSGNCVDGTCCNVGNCLECESCANTSGTCQDINAAEDPGTCNDDCTWCVNGVCVNRPAGDSAECPGAAACQACTSAGGNCGAWTGAEGRSCTGSTSFCCAGNCRTPGGELGTPCGVSECAGSWTCDVAAAECSTESGPCAGCNGDQRRTGACDANGACTLTTDVPGGACLACQQCSDNGGTTSCTNRGAGADNTAPNLCQNPNTCNGSGACLLDLGQGCGADGACASAHCIDGICCGAANCGTCQRCQGAGTCQNIGGNGDPAGVGGTGNVDTCIDDCSYCNNGSCDARTAGDASECTGTCNACTTNGGNCGAWTGDVSGAGCTGTSYCCSGTCVSPGADYNNACGSGDCTGTWGCSGTTQRCSAFPNTCAQCTGGGDSYVVSTCSSSSGTACNTGTGTTTNCPACNACDDTGSAATCVPDGDINDYIVYGVDDVTNPNTCNAANMTCSGAGVCGKENGQGCAAPSECASGSCVDGTCCSTGACGPCQTCANASGVCAQDPAKDGNSCGSSGRLCCGNLGSAGCFDPAGAASTCGGGDCAGTWMCVAGTAVQCGGSLTRPCSTCTGAGNADQVNVGFCSSTNGEACDLNAANVDCPACWTCLDPGVGPADCAPGYSGVADTVGANQCQPPPGTQVCGAAGQLGVCQ